MASKKPRPQEKQDAYLLDLKRKFMRAQEICEPARKAWETDQDYYDGNQWTAEEKQILNARRQPALVANETKAAVNGVIGMVERGRTDPKAWGRTPQDTDSAEIVTDCLRYVADEQRFQSTKSKGLKDYFVQGVVVGVVEIDAQREVVIRKGRPEEFFYDPYSRETDFSDARYLGLAKWMDEADALALSDDEKVRGAISAAVDSNGLLANDSHDDRPKGWAWADSKGRRVMVIEMYHRKAGDWFRTVFVSGAIIEDGKCPYLDDRKRSFCNLIAQSAYVDRENQRYGIVRDLRGPQDGMNKIASKILHIVNVAKLRVDPGVQDIDAVRAEWAKPDGIITARKDQVEELGDRELAPAHTALLEFWDSKLRRLSPTPAIVGRQTGGQSGRALLAEQQAGMTEMAQLLAQFDDWQLRIYRAVWYCIKQFKTAPWYVRVTDDEDAPKYILLNGPAPVTGPDGQPVMDPTTGQPQMKIHRPAEMDVDIIIDTTPDTAVIEQEQFTKLTELVSAGVPIPPDALIEASSLPRKRQVLDKMRQAAEQQQGQPSPAQIEEQKAQIGLQANDAKNQQNAQAHAAELARQDEAGERQYVRDQELENLKHGNKIREQQEQARAAQEQRDAEHMHTRRMNDEAIELKRRDGDVQSAQKQRDGDQAFEQKRREGDLKVNNVAETQKAKSSPAVGITLNEATEAAIAKAQETSAEAMAQAAKSMDSTAKSVAKLAESLSKPRKTVLRKDPKTGEKYAEQV